jgi:hypothetical protein
MTLWIGDNCLDQAAEAGMTKVWGLVLNPMTANAERGNLKAASLTREELVGWVRGELADEPYNDGNWRKVFKANSPLEWYNLPIGHGIEALDGPSNDTWGHGVIKLELLPEWQRVE